MLLLLLLLLLLNDGYPGGGGNEEAIAVVASIGSLMFILPAKGETLPRTISNVKSQK